MNADQHHVANDRPSGPVADAASVPTRTLRSAMLTRGYASRLTQSRERNTQNSPATTTSIASRADPADRRGIALAPDADLEGQVLHVDRPGVGRRERG